MKILLDTNILLDLILSRVPFVENSEKVLKISKNKQINLYMTATTVTDLFYIARKELGKEKTLEMIHDLLEFMNVIPVDKAIIVNALNSKIADFEDAIQECSAKQASVNIIITRNEIDFEKSEIEIQSPQKFIESESMK